MKGQYILTGSASPVQKGILHSGAGRIATIRMRPMSLYESGDSDGLVSLFDICKGKYINTIAKESNLKEIIGLIVRGGWPGSLDLEPASHGIVAKEYLNACINHDIYRLEGINRDTKK